MKLRERRQKSAATLSRPTKRNYTKQNLPETQESVYEPFNQIIVKLDGIPVYEIHQGHNYIFGYSFTLNRKLCKHELLAILREWDYEI